MRDKRRAAQFPIGPFGPAGRPGCGALKAGLHVRARRLLADALLGATGAGFGLVLTRRSVDIGPLAVRAALGVAATGGTRVDLGLLGTAQLPTHAGPLALRVTAGPLEVDRAAALLDAVALENARAAAPQQAVALVRQLVPLAGAGALVGATAGTAVATRRWSDVAVGTGIAATALAAAALRGAVTVDRTAWQHPQLTGLLRYAPKLLGDLRAAPQRLERYRAQLVELLATAGEVYQRVADLPAPPAADSIRLVHVSDIHLSPLALPLAQLLVERYDAVAVLDTGDLVDWGTPAEEAFVAEIGKLGVPYVYIKGNHDSAGIAAAVARQPNATVLDGTVTEVAGLTIAGMPDPRFTADKTTGDDHGMPKVAAAAQRFARQLPDGVDIALVHSPAAGRALAGVVPLVLAGDIHRREVRRLGSTTMLVQGSSGGAGLRGVQHQPPVPLTLSVLHLDRDTRRLAAVDEVTLGGLGRTEVSIVRRTVADAEFAARLAEAR
jgi:predicted MPP superfamily phosphohydrolase